MSRLLEMCLCRNFGFTDTDIHTARSNSFHKFLVMAILSEHHTSESVVCMSITFTKLYMKKFNGTYVALK